MEILLFLMVAAGGALGSLKFLLPRVAPMFVFYPEPLEPREGHPRYWGFPDATEVRIPTFDGPLLHAWWFPALTTGASSGAVIYFHGNAGNVGDRGTVAAAFAGLGLDVLLFDYRGYGLSDGKPTEEGLYSDARAVYQWLVEERGAEPGRLFLVGNSIGSAVAIHLATQRKVAGLILLGAFTNTPALARRRLPWVPTWLLDWKEASFDSLTRIGMVRAPLFMGVGSEDDVVTPANALELYEAAPEPKRWYTAEGAQHNDIFTHEGLWEELYSFTYEVLVGQRSA